MRHYLMEMFGYKHLPESLQMTSSRFADLAEEVHSEGPMNPEREKALNKLLEAKDCAVRAQLLDKKVKKWLKNK